MGTKRRRRSRRITVERQSGWESVARDCRTRPLSFEIYRFFAGVGTGAEIIVGIPLVAAPMFVERSLPTFTVSLPPTQMLSFDPTYIV